MLRAGRTHTQALRSHRTLHSSCARAGQHALALGADPAATSFARVDAAPSTAPTHSCPPLLRPPHICALRVHRGRLPCGILDTIDAFSAAAADDIARIVSHVNASFKLRRYIRQRESARRLALFLASTTRPSRAHAAMSLAHALGCRFKPNHFESVVHQLSLKENWSSIPPLVSLARAQCGKTTARLLNWKTRAFIECHRFACLDHMPQEFSRENVPPTRRTFHLLVSGHLRNQDLDSAKKCLLLMESAGFPVDASTHGLIVTAYRSFGLDPHVHARALDALPHVDVRSSTRILNSIVQQFLDAGDEIGAAEHISRMMAPLAAGKARDASTRVDGVLPSFADAPPRSSGGTPVIHPDAATFTIIINYLNTKRHFHRVHKTLNRMAATGIEPDAGVVAALIRTYCLSGRDDVAMNLLAVTLGSDADARKLLAFLGLKGECQLPINAKGVDLTVHVFNAAFPRILEIRGLGGAMFIFRIMRSRDVRPNTVTVEALLDYLDRIEHIQTGQLTRVLRSVSRTVHGPTIRHLNIVIRNALRREKHKLYGSGWDNTAAKFSSKRRYTFRFPENRTILHSESFDPSGSHHHPNDCSRLRSTVLALSRKGANGDRATFAMWLRHEGIADPTLETVKSVYRYMINKGMHPNRYHFTSLMACFTRAGDMQSAEQVMRSAKTSGFEPDVVMWTVLISGYGRKGEPKLAMRAFRTMMAAGISPDVPAIDALAHAYFAVGAYSMARKILLELWHRVKPFPSELKNAPLKQLACVFRQPQDPSYTVPKDPLTVQEQRSFNRKLRRILQEWKQ